MIKATIILGEQAVEHYNETGHVPTERWLMDNGGIVDDKEFRTKGEYDAYVQALSDSDGWSDYHVIKRDEEPDNCPFCRQWQDFFQDKQSTVYCPDCGRPILNIHV